MLSTDIFIVNGVLYFNLRSANEHVLKIKQTNVKIPGVQLPEPLESAKITGVYRKSGAHAAWTKWILLELISTTWCPKPSKLLNQMVFGGQQESLVQTVSVSMPEAIHTVKQVEVVFSGQQDKSSSQYTTNRVW